MAISEYPKHITTHLNPGEKVAKVQLLKDFEGVLPIGNFTFTKTSSPQKSRIYVEVLSEFA